MHMYCADTECVQPSAKTACKYLEPPGRVGHALATRRGARTRRRRSTKHDAIEHDTTRHEALARLTSDVIVPANFLLTMCDDTACTAIYVYIILYIYHQSSIIIALLLRRIPYRDVRYHLSCGARVDESRSI